jgi:hypothetical protein
MTDLTQLIVQREGTIEYLTANEIRFNHRGDKVTLRGPVHALVRYVKDDGKEKKLEELVLRTPAENRTFVNEEKEGDRYDIVITDLGELPQTQTILDLVLDRKHLEVVNTTMFVGKHRDDMVRVRGPARFRVEYKDKHGSVTKAEDIVLNGPADTRDFVNKKEDEDMYLMGSVSGAVASAPAPAPTPMYAPPPPAPAPAPVYAPPPPPAPTAMPGQPAVSGGFLGLPEGTLLRSPGSPAVYVIEGGKKRHVTSPAVAQKYGYNLGNVRVFSDIEVAVIPMGEAKN